MSDNNDILPKLLEEWVKELKVEIKDIHKCGDVLRGEISNLRQEVATLTNLNSDMKEIKIVYTKWHDDHEIRMRTLESSCHDVIINKETSSTSINNLEKLVNTKIDAVVLDTKKNSNNWVWTVRYVVTATFAILIKVIFF